MLEFIKKIYINIVRISLFSIFLWFCGFILYFIVGYFQIPSSEKRTFKDDIDCCEIILDANFRVDSYWNDIIDRKGNINYILDMKIKDNFKYEYHSNNKDYLNISFLDKDGFVLLESIMPISSLIVSADNNNLDNIKGFSNRAILLDSDNKYDNKRFDFTKYNQIKTIDISYNLQGIKKIPFSMKKSELLNLTDEEKIKLANKLRDNNEKLTVIDDIPKGWEEVKPDSKINEKDIIWDKK